MNENLHLYIKLSTNYQLNRSIHQVYILYLERKIKFVYAGASKSDYLHNEKRQLFWDQKNSSDTPLGYKLISLVNQSINAFCLKYYF